MVGLHRDLEYLLLPGRPVEFEPDQIAAGRDVLRRIGADQPFVAHDGGVGAGRDQPLQRIELQANEDLIGPVAPVLHDDAGGRRLVRGGRLRPLGADVERHVPLRLLPRRRDRRGRLPVDQVAAALVDARPVDVPPDRCLLQMGQPIGAGSGPPAVVAIGRGERAPHLLERMRRTHPVEVDIDWLQHLQRQIEPRTRTRHIRLGDRLRRRHRLVRRLREGLPRSGSVRLVPTVRRPWRRQRTGIAARSGPRQQRVLPRRQRDDVVARRNVGLVQPGGDLHLTSRVLEAASVAQFASLHRRRPLQQRDHQPRQQQHAGDAERGGRPPDVDQPEPPRRVERGAGHVDVHAPPVLGPLVGHRPAGRPAGEVVGRAAALAGAALGLAAAALGLLQRGGRIGGADLGGTDRAADRFGLGDVVAQSLVERVFGVGQEADVVFVVAGRMRGDPLQLGPHLGVELGLDSRIDVGVDVGVGLAADLGALAAGLAAPLGAAAAAAIVG